MMTLMNTVIATINKCSTCTCQLGAKLKWDLCSAPVRYKTPMILHSGHRSPGRFCVIRDFFWPGLMNHPILHSVLNSCVQVLDAKWSSKVPVLLCCINKSFPRYFFPITLFTCLISFCMHSMDVSAIESLLMLYLSQWGTLCHAWGVSIGLCMLPFCSFPHHP